MPIYAYRCESCGFAKDVLQKISDPVLTDCPECGQAKFQKQVTAAGFQLKGSGWYVTDFRDGKGGKPAIGKIFAGRNGILGVLTEDRGNDIANIFGMLLGIAAVLILAKIQIPLYDDPATGSVFKFSFGGFMPDWWPAISWPYFVLIGCSVTFAFSILFASKKVIAPQSQLPA